MSRTIPSKSVKSDGRHRILIAAETVATRDGARRLTLDTAAKEAGMSKGGVLYHFPTKHALLAGMLDRAMHQMNDGMTELRQQVIADGAQNPTLRALIQVAKVKLCDQVEVRIALVAGVSEFPELLDPLRDRFQSLWHDIRKECPDHNRAFSIWTAMEGLLTMQLFGVSPVTPIQSEDFFDHLTREIDALPYTEVSI
jgi:AcrR family transcriptional regulator